MKYGKEKREKKMYGGKTPYKYDGKVSKKGSQPSYGHGEMPKCMPK